MLVLVLILLFVFRKSLKCVTSLLVKGAILAILVLSLWNSKAFDNFLKSNYNDYTKEMLLSDLVDVGGEFVDIVTESTLEFVKETSDDLVEKALNDSI